MVLNSSRSNLYNGFAQLFPLVKIIWLKIIRNWKFSCTNCYVLTCFTISLSLHLMSRQLLSSLLIINNCQWFVKRLLSFTSFATFKLFEDFSVLNGNSISSRSQHLVSSRPALDLIRIKMHLSLYLNCTMNSISWQKMKLDQQTQRDRLNLSALATTQTR